MNYKSTKSDLRPFAQVLAAVAALICLPALGNGIGENISWQFQTSVDKANQAAVQDMIQKRNMGYYNPQVYTTNIARQINCNVSAQANGNEDTQSAVALSPSTPGASAGATGNENADTGVISGTSGSNQLNKGNVGANVAGNTTSGVTGEASQVLNNTQTNSGTQTANTTGSTGCSVGVLN
jgi:hypothetical protein